MATAKWYGLGMRAFVRKEVHWSSDNIKGLLTTSSYTPNQDTHAYKSDLSAELTGTGYTAGGVLLANRTITYDGANNRLVLDADDLAWPGAAWTGARNLIIYDDTPATDATKPLLGFVDFGVDQSPSSVTFSVLWDALGVLNLAAA